MKLFSLNEIKLKQKKVLVRVDWNVPLSDDSPPRILDDSRLRASFKTFDFLLSAGADKILILTHLGRPAGRRLKKFSVAPLRTHFQRIYQHYQKDKFTLLENIRFYPGELKNDIGLAKKYASLADVYVNDAFSVCHRNQMSVVALARLLPHAAGFELLAEVQHLSKLRQQPRRPFAVVIGGAKIQDKKPAVLKLSYLADLVLVGGRTAVESLTDPQIAARSNVFLPLDYRLNAQGEKWDIGDQTINYFIQKLKQAKTIFWNGNLGKSEEKEFAKGSIAIAKYLANLSARVVVAGGDTIELIDNLDLRRHYDYVSLGGGASLKFLSGESLPGLKILQKT